MPTRGLWRRAVSLWLGPLVGLAGLVSYFVSVARLAPVSHLAWVSLPLVGAGVGMSLGVLWRRRTAWSFVALAVSVMCATILFFHVFVLANLPSGPGGVVPIDTPVPRLTGPERGEREVRLGDPAGDRRTLARDPGGAPDGIVRPRVLTDDWGRRVRPEALSAAIAPAAGTYL